MIYLTLPQFLYLAERVLDIDAVILEKGARIPLAESALRSPAAGFGEDDFYPDPTDKAAVLCAHLTWNHPLPDGNKRTAWLAMRAFVELNGGHWVPLDDETVERYMLALAAGVIDQDEFADWLRTLITWPG